MHTFINNSESPLENKVYVFKIEDLTDPDKTLHIAAGGYDIISTDIIIYNKTEIEIVFSGKNSFMSTGFSVIEDYNSDPPDLTNLNNFLTYSTTNPKALC